jgi:hypothetical protein
MFILYNEIQRSCFLQQKRVAHSAQRMASLYQIFLGQVSPYLLFNKNPSMISCVSAV